MIGVSECTWLCQRSTTAARKGCTMPPLLNIPFEFVVVDALHLFLRIMGLLFHQVIPQASYKEMPFSHANPFEIFEGETDTYQFCVIYCLNIGC